MKSHSSAQVWDRGEKGHSCLRWDSGDLPRTHRVVIRVQVGHEHSSKGAQDPVHIVAIVTTQLPKCTFPTVQKQGLVGATEK